MAVDQASRRRLGRQRPGSRISLPMLAFYLTPALVLYTALIVYPLFSALQYSLFNWEGEKQSGFAGLDNFTYLFTHYPMDKQLRSAFWHNTVFFIGTVVIQNTAGLLFAVLLNKSRRGKRFLQTAFTMPHLVAPLVVGYLWTMILNPQFGALNTTAKSLGLGFLDQPWQGDPDLALPVVIVVNAWQWVGFPMLLFGAALAGIPEEYHEAARVDGASAWRSFRKITLPLLTPAIGVVTVLTFVGNFNVLDVVYAMQGSQGNPSGSTDVLTLLFYRTAYDNPDPNHIGQSSALAVLMFAFIFGISLLVVRIFRRMEARLR